MRYPYFSVSLCSAVTMHALPVDKLLIGLAEIFPLTAGMIFKRGRGMQDFKLEDAFSLKSCYGMGSSCTVM